MYTASLRKKYHQRYLACLMYLCLACNLTIAQNRQPKPEEIPQQLWPPHPANKIGARYFNIDQKRRDEDMRTEDAMPRSREFKRIDSTYYVGWMFEGVYKYNKAADYLGYKNASIPLAKALDLFEHDYKKALSTRTTELMTYYPIYRLHIDYTMIAYYLYHCYANTEQQEKAYELLRRVIKWDLQRSYYMDAWNYLAWTVHRNRFYTSAKYPFLKNSIEENEALANKYLDTSMMMIARNKALHDHLEPGRLDDDRFGVYHYRNILYSYSFEIDSAQHYFDLMRDGGRLPHNNYATFNAVCGKFRTAEKEYQIASEQDAADKRLQEWAYYTTILDIYKGQPKQGVEMARNMLQASGTTPGYGWYNIALARSLMYDGQTENAAKYTDVAADFKELHIGTTLGQSHYEFSIQLLKLIEKERQIQMLMFENKNWWYNPVVLFQLVGKVVDKFMQQYLIINQFSQNPERDRVIYKLFSNESTVSWDEVWYLVHDFSTKYFIRKFDVESATDKREAIRKYFTYFVATLKMKQGNYKEAKAILDELYRTAKADPDYERLFIARLFQAQAACSKKLDQKNDYASWMYQLYSTYPQLVPFSGLPMQMNITVTGEADKEVMGRLKDCNIKAESNNALAPNAVISFRTSGKQKLIEYTVTDQNGKTIVEKQAFSWQKAGDAGTTLAYRLFNIGGNNSAPRAEEKQPS